MHWDFHGVIMDSKPRTPGSGSIPLSTSAGIYSSPIDIPSRLSISHTGEGSHHDSLLAHSHPEISTYQSQLSGWSASDDQGNTTPVGQDEPFATDDLDPIEGSWTSDSLLLEQKQDTRPIPPTVHAVAVHPPESPTKRAPPPQQQQQQQQEFKKKPTKAERRAFNEARRAAKQQANNNNKPVTPQPTPAKSKKKIQSQPPQQKSKDVSLFSHLPPFNNMRQLSVDPQSATMSLNFKNTKRSIAIHPAIKRLGLQYAHGHIVGSNSRAIALLRAFASFIRSYQTPEHKVLSRDLEQCLKPQIQFLIDCRPLSNSMGNAIKHIKLEISQISPDVPESEAKSGINR